MNHSSTEKIYGHIALYAGAGPSIWFTHKANKKTYKLLSALHPADANYNGRRKDGVIAQAYNEDGPQWRTCFIEVDKILEIWREPDHSFRPSKLEE